MPELWDPLSNKSSETKARAVGPILVTAESRLWVHVGHLVLLAGIFFFFLRLHFT